MRYVLLGIMAGLVGLACQPDYSQNQLLSGYAEDLWGSRINLAEWHDHTVLLHPINAAT